MSRGKFGGVEGKREPMAILLQDCTNVGVRGVGGQTEGGGRIWIGKESGLVKGRLGSLEGGGHRRSPVEGSRRALECIGERLEKTGGMRKETGVKVDEAKKTLEVLNSLWLGVLENGVYVGGEGKDTCGNDMVAKEGDRRLSKGAFGEVD